VNIAGVCSISGDLSQARFAEQAVERTVRELGKLDILVNNASYQQHADSLEAVSDEQWDHSQNEYQWLLPYGEGIVVRGGIIWRSNGEFWRRW
jgi:hypothetical protein